MDVLVDYNNILQHERKRGIVYVVDKIVSTLGLNRLAGDRRLAIRLYGGWYEKQIPTRAAQQISADILASYPTTMILKESHATARILIHVELAYSIRIDPARHLWHTYRPKGLPHGLECRLPSSAGCSSPGCPLRGMYEFFRNNKCPQSTCSIKPRDLIHRKEQKLVDTMLAADVFYNIHTGADRLVVVSSDDDVWPLINTALQCGLKVFHVHTIAGRSGSTTYTGAMAGDYDAVQL